MAEDGRRSGALAGLIGGAVAAPMFVLGATLGSAVAVQSMGTAEIATILSDMLGQEDFGGSSVAVLFAEPRGRRFYTGGVADPGLRSGRSLGYAEEG